MTINNLNYTHFFYNTLLYIVIFRKFRTFFTLYTNHNHQNHFDRYFPNVFLLIAKLAGYIDNINIGYYKIYNINYAYYSFHLPKSHNLNLYRIKIS